MATAFFTVLSVLFLWPPARFIRGSAPKQKRIRRSQKNSPVISDIDILLDLLNAALSAGIGIPSALESVGDLCSQGHASTHGEALKLVGTSLHLGSTWERAWNEVSTDLIPIRDALSDAWTNGSAPSAMLISAAASIRRQRRFRIQESVQRLSVRLVVPLGLCFLPAFFLLTLAPVLISMGSGVLGL